MIPLYTRLQSTYVQYLLSFRKRTNMSQLPGPRAPPSNNPKRTSKYHFLILKVLHLLTSSSFRMGAFLSRNFPSLFGSRQMRILMVGLDAAGKTTILYKLKLNENVTTIPTIGTLELFVIVIISLYRIQCRNFTIQVDYFHSLGRRRSRPNPSLMASLLQQHPRNHLRCRQQ